MSHGAEKTNAMRIMEQKKAKYVFYDYTASGAVSGEDVAAAMGQDPGKVFKTLVTVGMSGKNYVFVVPVCKELDLPRPVMLSKHERDLRQFSHVVFKPSDFIEPVAFDTFELTLFYEKKKEEPTE